jgi:hypothetical protein
MAVDGRRLRRQSKDYFGFYSRMDSEEDIALLDKIIKEQRNPPNREVIHLLLANYAKHNKLEMMT